jgi:hypothetical protein
MKCETAFKLVPAMKHLFMLRGSVTNIPPQNEPEKRHFLTVSYPSFLFTPYPGFDLS